jgi:hypothetical protein
MGLGGKHGSVHRGARVAPSAALLDAESQRGRTPAERGHQGCASQIRG